MANTEHNSSLQDLQDRVVEELEKELGRESAAAFVVAMDHHYRCPCDTCLEWWARMGPDGEEPGSYGPFTKERVNAEQIRLGIEVTP